ncbi:MAG TPA: response regulator, partial [Burkholderiaceae bacterium]|nr:response regulator [Burkholderiaceae bacterium]
KPHIVFCDIGLPGLDGYEVARALRGDPESADIYLVALTGYGQQEDQRRTREAGFDLHLVKPVDDSALEMALAMNRASLEEGKSYRPGPRA